MLCWLSSNAIIDDVAIVCNHLKITKFSILAHSAGAIYALATALRIPQHIRARIHLLAPWIPPSQLSSLGTHKEPLPNNAVPYSQRILRALPTPILKVANSSFMNATSSSLTTSLPKSPRRSKRKSLGKDTPAPIVTESSSGVASSANRDNPQGQDPGAAQDVRVSTLSGSNSNQSAITAATLAAQNRERQTEYDTRLTYRIWELATTNANPAVDLLVCLERRQTIGFRYVDINREVVIHHGSRDTRVPVDNVRWLGKTMRRCEVRVLEGEGHGLMASAVVMGNVLTEIAQEWEDWTTLVQGKRGVRRATVTHHSSRSGIMV
jgi:pimeloyl-ACP methyl ester carboxylesterase